MSAALILALFATTASGAYLALSRDVLRIVVGLALLGNAVNLLLLASGRVGSAQPAVIAQSQLALTAADANALPQALVLTAIVIGFALLCLSMVLVLRLLQTHGSDDALALRSAEPAEPTNTPYPALHEAPHRAQAAQVEQP